MKTTKRFLSAIMAMTMVCGSAVYVSAEEAAVTEPAIEASGAPASSGVAGSQEGQGASEGWVETEIMRVVLPTDSLDFVVDAQGLIKQSYASGLKGVQNYAGSTIVYSNRGAAPGGTEITDAKVVGTEDNGVRNDGFIFFTKTDTKGKKTLTNHIDLVLTNKGTYDVDITPQLSYAKGTDTNSIDGEWNATGTPASKKLAFRMSVVGEDGNYSDLAVSNTTATTANNVKALYKVKYVDNSYSYTLDDAEYKKATDLNNTVTFTLDGAVDPAAVTSTDNTAGKLSIVWTVKKHTT